MAEDVFEVHEAARSGVEHCRQGQWDRGYRELCRVASADRQRAKLPSVFYSYLGFGMARYDKRWADGEKLCRRAIELEFFEPENYVNLAKVYGLRGMRQQAVETLRKGLQIDSTHSELRSMLAELGVRKKPVLSFLPRESFLNRMLGRIRHDFRSGGKQSDEHIA